MKTIATIILFPLILAGMLIVSVVASFPLGWLMASKYVEVITRRPRFTLCALFMRNSQKA